MSEQTRRANNLDKLIAYLQRVRRASHMELMQVAGIRYGARIFDARKLGHDIVTDSREGGLVYYEYRGFMQPGQIALAFTEAA